MRMRSAGLRSRSSYRSGCASMCTTVRSACAAAIAVSVASVIEKRAKLVTFLTWPRMAAGEKLPNVRILAGARQLESQGRELRP